MTLKILSFAAAALMLTAAGAPVQSDIDAAGPKGALKGTLLSPRGTAPVVLIIPGSGPTDRDGNSPLGIRASSYRLLAEALAEQGIATVRIDKRGMFASAAAVPDGNAVSIEDYAQDVHRWIGSIRSRTGRKCVWVAGHSEGGLVALAASREAKDLCGLILISSPGRRTGDVMRAQLRTNPANAPVLEDALSAITKLEAGQPVDVSAFHPALQGLFAPPIQPFLISLFSYDPAQLLKEYAGPVLILQGESDLQVTMEDAKRLAEAQPRARLVTLAGVNHALKLVPADDRAANMASYADPNLPLAAGVASAIADFVTARSTVSSPAAR